MTKTTSRTTDDNPLTRLSICLSQRRVDCYAGAEKGRSGRGIEAVRDGCDVVCGGNDVLLESTWSVIARDFLFSKVSLVLSILSGIYHVTCERQVAYIPRTT